VRSELETKRLMLEALDDAIDSLANASRKLFRSEIISLQWRRDAVGSELGTLEHGALETVKAMQHRHRVRELRRLKRALKRATGAEAEKLRKQIEEMSK
jgi:hypothetical protein